MSLQHQLHFYKLLIAAGASAYYHSSEGWQTWPGLDISYRLLESFKIYGSIAQGFRSPTFTELYYSGGGLSGNSKLEAEESINYELGVSWRSSETHFDLAVFQRENTNLIDYVQNPFDEIFYAQNFTEVRTKGLETGFQWFTPLTYINKLFVQYSKLDSDLDIADRITQYSLNHFKQQIILGGSYEIPITQGLSQSWKIRYEERLTDSRQTTVDTRISWMDESLRIFIDVTNLLDEIYEDIPGMPMPGRWFKMGFEYNVRTE